MNTRQLTLLMVIALPVAAATLAPEENARRLTQIDRDQNQKISSHEVLLGLLNVYKGGKIDFSLPLDVSAIPEAIARLPAGERDFILDILLPDFQQRRGTKEDYEFSEVDGERDFKLPEIKAALPPVEKLETRFLLRRNFDKMPAGPAAEDTIQADMQKTEKLVASGALFSYGRASGGDEQISAEGLFAYEQPFSDHWAPGTLGRLLYSVGFQRINFIGGKKPSAASPRFSDETSYLAPAITYESGLDWPKFSTFSPAILRANVLYITDWDFESQIPQIEVELSFVNGAFGLGSYKQTDHLWWRGDFTLHADGGYVVKDGEWTKHEEGDGFAHLGPKVSIKLRPFPKADFMIKTPVVVDLSWLQYEKLTSDSKRVRDVSAEISWLLSKPGKSISEPAIALTVEYKNLKNVENKKEDDSIISGFSIGY